MNNWQDTLLSQYANSPILLQLIESLNDAIDPSKNIDAFYNQLWNIDTAQGYGLDVWGRIVGVSRNFDVPYAGKTFGFDVPGDSPQPYLPFNFGIFYTRSNAGSVYALGDDAYRQLILFKAFANIIDCSIPSLNALARTLFGYNAKYVVDGYVVDNYYANDSSSRAYVVDNGGMSMTYVFDFHLNPVQAAIANAPGLLPAPTGVSVSVTNL